MRKILLSIFLVLILAAPVIASEVGKPLLGRQINWSHPIAGGLIGCWLLNEGSGNIIQDLSGNGGTTNEVSVFTWGVGKYGSCLQHTGANDQEIELPDLYKPLDGKTGFTVRIICKPNAITIDYALFVADQFDVGDSIVLWFDNGSPDSVAAIITASGGTTGVVYSQGGFLPVGGNWYDIILTWDGTTVRLYADGIEDTGGDFPAAGATGTLIASFAQYHIGNDPLLFKDFEGSLDSCMLWNRALSASEIAQLYINPFCMFKRVPIWMIKPIVITVGGQVIIISM